MEPRNLGQYALQPVSFINNRCHVVLLYTQWARADNATQPGAARAEVEAAKVQYGSGFQQLREAVSQSNLRKRAFANDETITEASTNDGSDVTKHENVDGKKTISDPSPKRSRALNWPLKSSIEPGDDGKVSPPALCGKRTSSRGRSSGRKTVNRLSKFQEGSLNDKPSKQPPEAFIGAEDAMEYYCAGQGEGLGRDDRHDPGSHLSRPSPVFRFGRFGKAVATVWQGIWKEKDPPAIPSKDAVLDERKANAEDAYALLKRNGFKGMQQFSTQREAQGLTGRKCLECYDSHANFFRDSRIGIDESQRPSPQTLRMEKPLERLNPPANTASKRSASPMPTKNPSHRSSSLHLRTPSFQTLKKAKSQIHMPSIKRPAELAPPLHASGSHVNDELATQGLRRQPSKKDLAKYQRLSKKVSDLESKLDIARRELKKSLQDVPPVPDVPAHVTRKPFTPGALASLPSERLLTPQTSAAPLPHTNTEIYGSTIVSSAPHLLSSPSRQLDHELNNSVGEDGAKNSGTIDSLLSSDPIAKPDIDGVDYASWTTAQAAKKRRKSSRRIASDEARSIDSKFSTGIKKRQVRSVPNLPKNSPTRKQEAVPPIPAISITADEANRPRPASPFLGRPVATSPLRTRSMTQKRGISPQPSCPTSASQRGVCFTIHDDNDSNNGKDTALSPSNTAGNRQWSSMTNAKGSPAPKTVQLKAARAKAVRISIENGKGIDKPLPEIQAQPQTQMQFQTQAEQEEDFKWDDDVF